MSESRTTDLWRETLALGLAALAIAGVLASGAFNAYFFGDDFIYIGQFWAHGRNFWRAVFSPTDNIFFRPLFCAFNLFWHAVLPPDPLAHHVRNFIFTGINLVLIHRVLVRLAVPRPGRILAVLLFAVSKVHLTAIGYINVFDTIVTLMLLLLAVLSCLRYLEAPTRGRYAALLLFASLSILTKDYGIVVNAVILAAFVVRAIEDPGSRTVRPFAVVFIPLACVSIAYLVLRWWILGAVAMPRSSPTYGVGLMWPVVVRKLAGFGSALSGISLLEAGTTGAGGVGSLLAARGIQLAQRMDAAVFAAFLLLCGVTIWTGVRHAKWALLLPFTLMAVYLGPTFLTTNVQMYYFYEPLAGAIFLVGVCLRRPTRPFVAAWAVAVAVVAANTMVSNWRSTYHWQFVANAAARIEKPVVEAYRGQAIDSITFVTPTPNFWRYTLTGDFKGPMLGFLLKRPGLKVSFAAPGTIPPADASHLAIDIDRGFVPIERAAAPAPTSLVLHRISPTGTRVGRTFGGQADGRAALSIACSDARPGVVVVFDNMRLLTNYGNSSWVTAHVPDSLYARPAVYQVHLEQGNQKSNSLEFTVFR